MIKINKKTNEPPESLIPIITDGPKKKSLITSQTTHGHRIELIRQKKYIDSPKYNKRYKLDDIKQILKKTYNNKCAYCEHYLELLDVEHYRPKSIYYWLAYSWDNLLLSCPTCNINKKQKFAIRGPQAQFDETKHSLKNINSLSDTYDEIEKPYLVNPEKVDPKLDLLFSKNGSVSSKSENLKYTIETCKLCREPLNTSRRKILEDFERDIVSIFNDNKYMTPDQQKIVLKSLIKQFLSRANDPQNDFIAFRQFCVQNDWLTDSIKKVLCS